MRRSIIWTNYVQSNSSPHSRTMRLTVSFFVVFTFLQTVFAYSYLFKQGTITLKDKVSGKKTKNIPYNFLTQIDQHQFANAVDIKVRTRKMNLFPGAVRNLPHLLNLRLKDCGIQELSPGCFRNLPRLNLLHLQENDLTDIKEGVFNNLPVEELWLHKNEIATIESSAFDDMPNLKRICLNKNFLRVWDSRWFANTPQLSLIYFRKNKIQELPARAFANIRTSHKYDNLETVDTKIFLSRNQISHIHPDALRGIDSLAELNLQLNKLRKLEGRVFAHMTELQSLMLARNYIREIDRDIFQNIDVVEMLDLSMNELACLPFEVVAKARKVNLTLNDSIDCDCIFNLMEKLAEKKIHNEIIAKRISCAFD